MASSNVLMQWSGLRLWGQGGGITETHPVQSTELEGSVLPKEGTAKGLSRSSQGRKSVRRQRPLLV